MTLQRFDYDKADNLLDEHGTTPITDNRLTLWQQLNNRYDEWGNLIERKTFDSHQHFDYDAENRLIKAYGKGPQGQHVTYYYYDGLGRRTSKQVTRQDSFSSRTETTTFLWQGLRLLQEHSPACFYSYLYEPNDDYSPLARINHNSNSNSIEYYHSEVNGQPLELTDSDGTILWSATYNSWGKLLRLNQINDREGRVFGIEQPLRYAGQYADNETGLHYNTFRYYDPEIGRFTQQDPIGLAGGINLYTYAPNPLGWVDPLGLYAGEGQRELGKYHVFHEHTLNLSEFGLSDAEHFRRGNQSVYERMQIDPAFKREMQTKYHGVVEHVQPSRTGRFKSTPLPGMTWHHGNSPGSLQLVDFNDHRTYHKIYHPDGSGGRKKWGGGTGCR